MVGNQGNKWLTARVSIKPSSGRQIIFEGVIGDNDFGDIAIDNISRYSGYCFNEGNIMFSYQKLRLLTYPMVK